MTNGGEQSGQVATDDHPETNAADETVKEDHPEMKPTGEAVKGDHPETNEADETVKEDHPEMIPTGEAVQADHPETNEADETVKKDHPETNPTVDAVKEDPPQTNPTGEENHALKKPNQRDKKISKKNKKNKKKKKGKKKEKNILEEHEGNNASGGSEEGGDSGSPLEMSQDEGQTEGQQISSVVSFLKRNERPPRPNEEGAKANEKQPTTREKTQKKPPRGEEATQEDKAKRSVFIGNLPLKDMHKAKLLKLLDLKKSAVESVRFRSQPMEEAYAARKKLGVILKKFTDAKDNQNAIITLKKEESLPDLLKKNGLVHEGYVLRINMLGEKPTFNRKKSVCIKNLDRKLNESDLYRLLKDVDEIRGIRILRDERTSVSTGVSFVLFQNRSSVKKAIEMFHGHSVNGRELVVEKIQRADDPRDAPKDATKQSKQVKRTIGKKPREEQKKGHGKGQNISHGKGHKNSHGKGQKNGHQPANRARRKKKYVRRKRKGGAAAASG
ncbi:RNA binding protein [Plasmodium vivax North Korean]|uniref:RNA binding protein n=1 Tax=Plasmodium vivax North Korean TaxID=1035514 RepID=A0A0J9TYW5_PLAVI|nr:RNA binding protein [Plasmodium vivax North Korean]